MTRLAILADVHGNLPALEAVLDDVAQFSVDQIIVAGDVVYRAPFSGEVVARLVAEGAAVVRGNAELKTLTYGTPYHRNVMNDLMVGWASAQLVGRLRAYVAAWPDELTLRYPDGPPVRVVHSIPGNPYGFIQWDMDDETIAGKLAGVDEPVVVGGHTHLTLDRQVGPWRYLNPGAVGTPFDGVHDAGYMLLETTPAGWQPTWRRVPYDRERLFDAFTRHRVVERFGWLARLTVEEFRVSRLRVSPFFHWHRKTCPGVEITPLLVEHFLREVDPWPYTLPPYCINRDVLEAL